MVKSNASLFVGLADNNLYEAHFRRYIGHDERLHINQNVLMPCKVLLTAPVRSKRTPEAEFRFVKLFLDTLQKQVAEAIFVLALAQDREPAAVVLLLFLKKHTTTKNFAAEFTAAKQA